jgi:hypothetical protein
MYVYRMSQNCPPREKREYLGKCDNLNFKEKVLSQAVIEKRHPKLDKSELRSIKVGWPQLCVSKSKFSVNFSLIVAISIIIIFAV